MANEFGGIYETRQKGRKPRWRIFLGKRDGRMLWISRLPSRRGTKLPPFESREQAQTLLDMMRSAIRSGGTTPDEIIDAYLPEEFSKELVETWATKYLDHWRARVSSGDKSPNTLREIERWSKAEGHWGWWWNRDARTLTNGDVEEWHRWLAARVIPETDRTLGAKTRNNISDGFRAMLRWASMSGAQGAGQAWPVPNFPHVSYSKTRTATLPVERVLKVLEAIPWERRGIFLAVAFESLRFSAGAAHLLEDYDTKTGEVFWHRGRQGQRLDAPVRGQKNNEATRRVPWAPELIRWLNWRVEQATDEDKLAGRAQSLLWDPLAHNSDKAWNYTSYRRCWNAACLKAGEDIAPQAGTRHSILSRLAEVLTPDALKGQSQHRSLQSLAHYTIGAKPNHAAMDGASYSAEAGRLTSRKIALANSAPKTRLNSATYGGAGGDRTRDQPHFEPSNESWWP